jgi:hypothetical protein
MKTDPIELQKQLEGVDYPATKDDLVAATGFESPADVMSGLGPG